VVCNPKCIVKPDYKGYYWAANSSELARGAITPPDFMGKLKSARDPAGTGKRKLNNYSVIFYKRQAIIQSDK